MGHLLETGNPEAAQAIKDVFPSAPEPVPQEPSPPPQPQPQARETGIDAVPQVGDIVLYHPRSSEVRRGRKVVAGLVTWRDEEKRELELCLIHEANDVRQQDRVREWPGGEERGWEAKAGGNTAVDRTEGASLKGIADDIEKLAGELLDLRNLLLGDFEPPTASILDMLHDVDERVDALAAKKPAIKAVEKPAAKPAKKKAAKGK